MLFTHDTIVGLAFVVALSDTAPEASESGADELGSPARLTALLDDYDYAGRRDGDAAELAEVAAARTRLRELWMLDRDELVDAVNLILASSNAVPQLARHDRLDWHLHATSREAPLAERILVEASLALVDVIRADQTDRLRDCEAEDCGSLYVDLSKNASRRFCSTKCGNRMAVRAYRARQD
ncbi:CGNR zinc finger domain-containing protein [Agromyces seonyuensis]|uniref:RNA-binding protein n=1 Tax=Agromyces seonyuensis TaxID=2662446 RepID=A0A6I4NXY9_9MICO|nr:CGNR zinc finger domain-containing protein [Agromyces seonyuensis]MWB98012.1 RNA-binding protein [Agromyces seonyuensis]